MAGSWNGIYYNGDATNEVVTAYGGNEVMHGNEGDDNLSGLGGNDYLDGGVGNDGLDGGAGDDTLLDVQDVPFGFSGIIGHDTLRGGAGNDELRFYSIDTGDVADGGTGFDELWLDTGYFSNTTLPFGTVITFTMGPGGAASVVKYDDANTVAVSNMEVLTYFGVNAIDIITGGAYNDRIYGGDENDHLYGAGGDDYLDGGTGIQDMDGGAGFDTASFDLSGSTDAITLTNAATVNLGAYGSVRNFEAFDQVTLGVANNTVTLSQTSYATITALGGNNTFTITGGGLIAVTGAGTDTFNTGNGADDIDGGAGHNVAHMAGGDDEYTHKTSRTYKGSEYIWGEAGNDTIATAMGDDRTYGGDHNDVIYNGGGHDSSSGGAGDDEIYGENGRDSLYGGDGNDRIDSDRDYVATKTGIDADIMDGGNGNDLLFGGLGADRFIGGAGDDKMTVNYYTDNGNIDLGVDTLMGGLGKDTVALNGPGYSGTEALEVILAPTTLIKINGVIVAQAQQVEALELRAYGGGGHHFEGGDLADSFVTGQGNDILYGYGGNDTLQTTFGHDELYAGAGNDLINQVQMGGADLVYGGTGDDQIWLAVAYLSQTLEAGVSTVDGGLGNDTLNIYNSDRDVIFNGTGLFVGTTRIADITGFETLNYVGTNTANLMNGFAGNDSLLGVGGNDTLNGLGGDDSLDGGAGNDQIFGGAGNDKIISGGGADSQYGGLGNDHFTFVSDSLVDVIDGGTGLDDLTLGFGLGPIVMTGSLATGATMTVGGVLQATLTGLEVITGYASTGNDVLLGGSGNDSLYAYGGADTITTGSGNDTIVASFDAGFDEISMGLGSDRLSIQQSLAGNLSFTLSADAQVLIGGVSVAHVTGVEAIWVYAGAGNDSVVGGALNDTLSLGNGANSGNGAGGDDAFILSLDALTDTLAGGVGNDLLTLYGGTDVMLMDLSVPGTLSVRSGATVLAVATGFESVVAYGNYGANQNDTLRGLEGNDTLYGNAGNDLIQANGGDDLLMGGDGADTLTGNAGADRFVFSTLAQAPPTGTLDRITDFISGTDKIDLSAIDAITVGNFTNDAFIWIGAAAFSNVAGQLHYVQDVANNRTFVEVDVQGDGVADLAIRLDGVVTLLVTDVTL